MKRVTNNIKRTKKAMCPSLLKTAARSSCAGCAGASAVIADSASDIGEGEDVDVDVDVDEDEELASVMFSLELGLCTISKLVSLLLESESVETQSNVN